MPNDPPLRPCCGQDFERIFDESEAEHDLEQWQRGKMPAATRELIEVIRATGIQGASLLDIGAGVGAVHLELLEAGAARAVDVDASSAFLTVAAAEASRRGFGDRVEHRFGDVVELAEDLPPADVVTLDRVICCYPDLPALVDAATASGARLIGLVHPTDRWWMRASVAVFNVMSRLLRRHHAFYVHRRTEIDRLLARSGFAATHRGGGRVWLVTIYRRSPA
ncbi:MAG: class I SAM-dependent methyltransferase [Chloroflexota bacterium]